ncbi:MAG: phosphoribosylglycinamide formyltransferase [Candidatus Poseidoniales archaeon]|nr:MAG: phosphoribosylglycinamide formyltransferase [Candidatus Poseidoniales archaeon]
MDSIPVGGRIATADQPLRCAVFLSGSGSGMEALVQAQRTQNLLHQTVVVVANTSGIEGLERAQRLGVPALVVEQNHEGRLRSREEHEAEILRQMADYNVEMVVLSGYMRLLSPLFLSDWANSVVNIHPSFLPHFPGAHAHRDVLASQTTITGCTVHLVDEGMDTGAILAQRPVPVFTDDDEAALSARVKVEEHRLYPQVLTWIAEGRVHLIDGVVSVAGVEGHQVG